MAAAVALQLDLPIERSPSVIATARLLGGRSWEGCLELSLLRVEDARRSYSGDGLGVEMAPVKRCAGRRIWIARYGQLGSTGKGDVLQRKPVHLPNNRLSVKAKLKKNMRLLLFAPTSRVLRGERSFGGVRPGLRTALERGKLFLFSLGGVWVLGRPPTKPGFGFLP